MHCKIDKLKRYTNSQLACHSVSTCHVMGILTWTFFQALISSFWYWRKGSKVQHVEGSLHRVFQRKRSNHNYVDLFKRDVFLYNECTVNCVSEGPEQNTLCIITLPKKCACNVTVSGKRCHRHDRPTPMALSASTHRTCRLAIMYKILHGQVVFDQSKIQPAPTRQRRGHQHQLRQL